MLPFLTAMNWRYCFGSIFWVKTLGHGNTGRWLLERKCNPSWFLVSVLRILQSLMYILQQNIASVLFVNFLPKILAMVMKSSIYSCVWILYSFSVITPTAFFQVLASFWSQSLPIPNYAARSVHSSLGYELISVKFMFWYFTIKSWYSWPGNAGISLPWQVKHKTTVTVLIPSSLEALPTHMAGFIWLHLKASFYGFPGNPFGAIPWHQRTYWGWYMTG